MSEKCSADLCCRGACGFLRDLLLPPQKNARKAAIKAAEMETVIVLLQEVNVVFEHCANKSNELRRRRGSGVQTLVWIIWNPQTNNGDGNGLLCTRSTVLATCEWACRTIGGQITAGMCQPVHLRAFVPNWWESVAIQSVRHWHGNSVSEDSGAFLLNSTLGWQKLTPLL